MKPILARQMEVYAGFLEYADHHTGRVIDALEELGILDDTLVYYIIGDNGASAEGGLARHVHDHDDVQRRPRVRDRRSSGTSTSTSSAARTPTTTTPYGWAHAMCTPYQWTKQVASHYGGTRNGTIVHWPAKIAGQRRDPPPVAPRHRRRSDHPRAGRASRSRTPSTASPRSPCRASRWRTPSTTPSADERHTHPVLRADGQPRDLPRRLDRRDPAPQPLRPHRDGAGVLRWTTGSSTTRPPTGRRPTTSSAEHPEKLAELQQLLPDRGGTPQRAAHRRPGRRADEPGHRRAVRRLVEGDDAAAVPGHDPPQRERRPQHQEPVVLRSRREIDVPDGGARGRDRRPGRPHRWLGASSRDRAASSAYHYNYCGLRPHDRHAPSAAAAGDPPGPRGVRLRRRRHRPRRRRSPCTSTGRTAGNGRVERTHPLYYSFDEGLDVGMDTRYAGVRGVHDAAGAVHRDDRLGAQVDLGDDDHSHLIDPEDHLAAAMRHQ